MAQSLTSQQNVWLEARSIRGESTTLIDQLFNRLDGMYPQRWRSAFADTNAIRNWREAWADALADERITPQQVADAVRACRRKYDWPPSLTEFLKLCSPPVDYEAAFREAVEQMRMRDNGADKWSSPAVYWAAVEFGTWELRQATWVLAKTRWSRLLDEKLATPDLPPVPERREALPAPGKTTADPAKVRAMLDELRAKMAMPKVGA